MKLTINDREVTATGGMTILEVAEANNIYIPHLCAHPELTNYGGCRMCIVEVEGMRGYPTACTAKAEEGMKVHTHPEVVQEMRKEILQLILSEHPSGCLICDEKEECAGTMESIRKVGVTTGCRWCPKDGDCELQRVVQDLGIDSIKFPVYFQDLDVERYDPFFDRDYNLCIYCARCVRICTEHRKSFVLGLNERGKEASVGPAFHNSHIEAECEFCGACVSVCPTGALSEKNRKWSGVPTAYQLSLCPFCCMNCDVQIPVKKGKVTGVLPTGDPHKSGGELCVKGRFCLAEVVNHPDRVLEPRFLFPEGRGVLTWEEATVKAAELIKQTPGKRTALYMSPNLPMEEMAAADLFARKVLETGHVTSSVLDDNLAHYLALAEQSVSLEEVERSGTIISLFLRGNYYFAPLTLAMKRAAEAGTPLGQIGWTRDTVSRFASFSTAPPPGKEKQFFKKILTALQTGKGAGGDVKKVVQMIEEAPSLVFVLGPGIAELTEARDILDTIKKIAELTASHIFAPNPYGNLVGMLAVLEPKTSEEINALVRGNKIDLLYTVGDLPFAQRPPVKFIIHQGSFSPPGNLKTDLVLPAATWGEVPGSFAGRHGPVKSVAAAVKTAGSAMPNPEIFSRIAGILGLKEPGFAPQALEGKIPRNLSVKYPAAGGKTANKARVTAPDTQFPYLLIRESPPHGYHHAGLSTLVAGMAEILPQDTLLLNPGDAARLGLKEGDNVTASSTDLEITFPLKLQSTVNPGFVLLLADKKSRGFTANPCPVHLRRTHV